MNELSVYDGVIRTQGSYAFDENGSALMRIHLDGFGQFQAAGTVDPGGALSVLAEPRAFHNGQIFPIIQSGELLLNTFDEVSLPETRPLLGFALNYNYDDEQVEVISSTRPFRTVARNANERAIADYLDRIAPDAGGEMSRVLGEFQMLQENQHGQAFAGMSPAAYGGSTGAALQTARQYTHVVANRMQSLQAGASAPRAEVSAYGLEGILLAYNGPNASLGDVVGRQERADARRRWGAWANVFGQWTSQDADDGFVGYDSDTYGVVLGMDYALSENWLAGASFGYSTNDISFDENAGDGDIDSYFGSLYTGWYADAFYLESVLTYGSQEFDNKRNVVVGATRLTAHSDHDGNLYSAYLGSGYNFGDAIWQIGPFVSLEYLYLGEDGFEEKGAGVLNLIVDDRQTDALISQLGVRAARYFDTGLGALVPELSLAWLYDFDIDDRVITSSFAGASGDAFSITGQEVDQNGLVVGAALTLMQVNGIESSLTYSGEFRDGYDAHALIGQIRIAF
jgi:outer membrane autotransporter protein